ncbi:hypothetical protein L210DRAFT_2661149 [Boletus edulis BED1]|uniref:F-box domain-containing protein n=1 Tax=Boletus edulis BED1 TaxID=1328754 RepID=A0AAD4C5I1_BOLED|nr:hypothetical protein L210DRAFT_2661149 [Boletus edulis BED1]
MDYTTSKVAPVLPVEITYQILILLDPHELIHLQRVSKQFHAIINDSTLWRTVYAGAHLPRPPGPFPWQSTDFLRRTLVQSARLAQRWTSQPIRILSRHSLPLAYYDDCRWVCGRWLILRESTKQLVSHDVDTGFEQTLYQWHELANQCISWSATCRLTSSRGGLLHVVLCIGNDRVKLLEFRVAFRSAIYPSKSRVAMTLRSCSFLSTHQGSRDML